MNQQLGTLGKEGGNEALKENILDRVHRPLATEENKNAKTEVGAARLILEAEHFVPVLLQLSSVVIWICIKLLKPFSLWDRRMVNWIKEGFKKRSWEIFPWGEGFLKNSKNFPNFFSFYLNVKHCLNL